MREINLALPSNTVLDLVDYIDGATQIVIELTRQVDPDIVIEGNHVVLEPGTKLLVLNLAEHGADCIVMEEGSPIHSVLVHISEIMGHKLTFAVDKDDSENEHLQNL